MEERAKVSRPKIWKDDDKVDHINIPVDQWAFEYPAEARIRSMRAILQKFDVKVLVFLDGVEIHGQIPTKVMAIPSEALAGKVGREISSVY